MPPASSPDKGREQAQKAAETLATLVGPSTSCTTKRPSSTEPEGESQPPEKKLANDQIVAAPAVENPATTSNGPKSTASAPSKCEEQRIPTTERFTKETKDIHTIAAATEPLAGPGTGESSKFKTETAVERAEDTPTHNVPTPSSTSITAVQRPSEVENNEAQPEPPTAAPTEAQAKKPAKEKKLPKSATRERCDFMIDDRDGGKRRCKNTFAVDDDNPNRTRCYRHNMIG